MSSVRAPSACVLMIEPGATQRERGALLEALSRLSPQASLVAADDWAAAVVGEVAEPDTLAELPSVQRVVRVTTPFRLASREIFEGPPPPLSIGTGGAGGLIGEGAPFAILAEYPAPRDLEGLRRAAEATAAAGGILVHLGELGREDGAETLAAAAAIVRDAGLAASVEVSGGGQIPEAAAAADVLQVGSRNMQDFSLLRELGRVDRPVLLRRGFGATVEEFLLAAEYVLSHGNGRVILCESGIRTFGSGEAPRFEINAIPVVKRSTHLPLVADPCHATAHAGLVPAVSRAALAAGADGVFLELRPPGGPAGKGVAIESLPGLVSGLRPVAAAIQRRI